MVFYDQFATPLITQKPYDIQNLFVSFTPTNDRFTLKAFVKNIGNTAYHVSGFFQTSAFQQVGNWSPPRTYGADLTVRF